VGEKGVILEYHVHIPLVRIQKAHVPALKKNLAPVGLLKAGDYPYGGGFSASRRAEEGDKFPLINGKIESPEDLNRTETFFNTLKAQQFLSAHQRCSLPFYRAAVFCKVTNITNLVCFVMNVYAPHCLILPGQSEEGIIFYMKTTIVIIDGMGGGIGVQLIGKIRENLAADTEILALGTNAVATERMVRAGAHRGAAGENAIRVSAALGDFILGPMGIVITNSLMGEISSVMAEAVMAAPGERILVPLQQEHFFLAGLEPQPLAKLVDKAVDILKERLEQRSRP
jgi:hypothetical protein